MAPNQTLSPTRIPRANLKDCPAGAAPEENPKNSKPAKIVNAAAASAPPASLGEPGLSTLAAQVSDLRDSVYTNHEWVCFKRRGRARQHLSEALTLLDSGDHGAAAEALRAVADVVSLDANEDARARNAVKLTKVGQRAWALSWRDLNLRSRNEDLSPESGFSEAPPSVAADDELALHRLADDGNPNHEDRESPELRGLVNTAPAAPADRGPDDVENSEATVRRP